MKRDFPAAGINRKWYGDGIEIPTGEGKLYLDSVLDMGSRRILGHALGEHHDADLAYGALAMAAAVRGGKMAGVIFHSDSAEVFVKPRNPGLATWRGFARVVFRLNDPASSQTVERVQPRYGGNRQ